MITPFIAMIQGKLTRFCYFNSFQRVSVMEDNSNVVTVLYYDQNDMTSICTDVLINLELETDKRVIFPKFYRDNKIIIAVLDGNCRLRNSLGDRSLYS